VTLKQTNQLFKSHSPPKFTFELQNFDDPIDSMGETLQERQTNELEALKVSFYVFDIAICF